MKTSLQICIRVKDPMGYCTTSKDPAQMEQMGRRCHEVGDIHPMQARIWGKPSTSRSKDTTCQKDKTIPRLDVVASHITINLQEKC